MNFKSTKLSDASSLAITVFESFLVCENRLDITGTRSKVATRCSTGVSVSWVVFLNNSGRKSPAETWRLVTNVLVTSGILKETFALLHKHQIMWGKRGKNRTFECSVESGCLEKAPQPQGGPAVRVPSLTRQHFTLVRSNISSCLLSSVNQ